ncbi:MULTISPECIES: CYTH and CHAD domain-containing protein [unclassified Streptomyces]|uniref:CYTH and CHAD domain-containing protein n=1 Tax=unclassified Streptomyces TaxID=2593676 RepID=UPI00168B8E3E|nr:MULTISPECIES: CYTH and CHAD domain-containing protein [unclassified Streptomyces]MBD3003360.1 CYTH and CHAD domain-containing protein [Streptomyces sp. 5-10]
MVDTKQEIERKYEATAEEAGPSGRPDLPGLPELTGAGPVATVVSRGVATLEATYYDTPGRRLLADAITLRHRTGGDDEGWHLKLPVGPDTREELRAPLGDEVPAEMAALLRSRVRHDPLRPLAHLRTERDRKDLVDADGTVLAEVSVDRVTARRLGPEESRPVRWTEVEVELAEGRGHDQRLLDAVEVRLRDGGLHRADTPSKLAKALAETEKAAVAAGSGAGGPGKPAKPAKPGKPAKTARQVARAASEPRRPLGADDVVLDYIRRQVDALVRLDPAVRGDVPDAVHRMRVATRRLRSAFRSYRKVLDRSVTDPIGDELKWLAGELGVERDREVLTERLEGRLAELPEELRRGPVRERLHHWSHGRRDGARATVLGALDSERYLTLLDTLDALVADPPLRRDAAKPAAPVVAKAVLRDYERLAGRMATALETPPGPDRDIAIHQARKAAKRVRYAAETARPALGKSAKRFARRMQDVQDVLGDHQDSVVAREALRQLATQAHVAGESDFTFGLLYGREEERAAARERELPDLWAEVSREKHRADLEV